MDSRPNQDRVTRNRGGWIIFVLLMVLGGYPAAHGDEAVLFRDDFKSIDGWEPYFFPNIKQHSTYEVLTHAGNTFLKAFSQKSASALVSRQTFNIADHPVLRWRWKVDNILASGNYRKKSGDDYPIRIYVFFAYDPAQATIGTKVQYEMARALTGRYPPLRTLNYIWANRREETEVVASPFTKKSIMIPLRHGPQHVGQWVTETVNLLEDYRRAFDGDPPPRASLAIMSDSDNTGESATAYIQFIEVRSSVP